MLFPRAAALALIGIACPSPAVLIDADADGVEAALDCDDADPLRSPRVPERCDGVDQDCDGVVDDGFDADGDGFSACGWLLGEPVAALPGELPGRPLGSTLVAVDLDADGADELIATEFPRTRAPTRAWLYRSQPGCLLCERVALGDPASSVFAVVPLGDLDGDGHRELALNTGVDRVNIEVWRTHPTPALWTALSFTRTWVEIGPAPGPDGEHHALLFDMTTDGQPALLRLSADLAGQPVWTPEPGVEAWTVDRQSIGSFDLDLDLDLRPELATLTRMCPESGEMFTATDWPEARERSTVPCGPFDSAGGLLTAHDLDGDGHADAVWPRTVSTASSAYYQAEAMLSRPAPDSPVHVEVPFLNAHAMNDVGVVPSHPPLLAVSLVHESDSSRTHSISLSEVGRDGTVRPISTLRLPGAAGSFYPALAGGDFDGDGWAELAVGRTFMEGNAAFPGEILIFASRRDCDVADPAIQQGCAP